MQYVDLRRNGAVCFLLIGVLPMSGCGALWDRLDPTAVSPRGLSPSVESLNFEKVADSQNKLIVQLQLMAQLGTDALPATDGRWELVMKAGMGLVGEQCNEYMMSLFQFDKDHRALRSGLTATGATAAVIMGLTATPAAPIAGTAAAFGLATSFFDANVNSVVFQIGPAAVRNIVVQAQDTFRTTAMNNITNYQSRPDVILGLEGYLQLCTPVAIESAVEQAASSTGFDSKAGATTNDSNPALQQISKQPVPTVDLGMLISSSFNKGPSTARVMSWLYPHGTVSPDRKPLPPDPIALAALQAWMKTDSDPNIANGAVPVWLFATSNLPALEAARQRLLASSARVP